MAGVITTIIVVPIVVTSDDGGSTDPTTDPSTTEPTWTNSTEETTTEIWTNSTEETTNSTEVTTDPNEEFLIDADWKVQQEILPVQKKDDIMWVALRTPKIVDRRKTEVQSDLKQRHDVGRSW